MQKTKTVLLTGGHAGATAYALIEKIKEEKPNWNVVWVGARKAMEGKNINTLEYNIFPKMGIKFYPITTGRIQRKFTKYTIPSLIKIPYGFYEAYKVIRKIKPDIILSFGGFAAYPVVVTSWFFRIPVVIHEQTAVAGRANRYSSFFAKKIALSYESSIKFFPKQKCVVTGNPVSEEILSIKRKQTPNDPPILFVTGGSRGSEVLNEVVANILSKVLRNYRIIHQTGEGDFDRFMKIKNQLDEKIRNSYEVYPFFYPWEWATYIDKSDIVIGRSGANIVSEVIVIGKPSIFIPLAISYLDEQMENAKVAKKLGVAEIIKQEDLTGSVLIEKIELVKSQWNKIVRTYTDPSIYKRNASINLINLINDEMNA